MLLSVLALSFPILGTCSLDEACPAEQAPDACVETQDQNASKHNFRQVFAEMNFSEDAFVEALRKHAEGDWNVSSEFARLKNTGWNFTKTFGRIGTANLTVVQPVMTQEEINGILSNLPGEQHWDMESDDTDNEPRHRVWNYAVSSPEDLQRLPGWKEPLMGAKFSELLQHTHPILERILPHIREAFLCPDCIVRAAQIRRYPVGQRDSLPFHTDEDSTVTVSVQLNNADSFEGGFFIGGQDPESGNSTMQHVKLNAGDAVIHDSRLFHAIRTYGGDRHAWVIWIDPRSKLEKRWQRLNDMEPCDVNKDEALDEEEISCWIDSTNLPENKVWSLAYAHDEDSDDRLDRGELSKLIKLFEEPAPLVSRDFGIADRDGSKALNQEELLHLLKLQGLQAKGTLEQVQGYDFDEDEQVDILELNWWLRHVDLLMDDTDPDVAANDDDVLDNSGSEDDTR